MPAWNTSKTDPATGFIDFLKPRYENLKQAKDFFEKFDSIHLNSKADYFEFAFDFKTSPKRQMVEGRNGQFALPTMTDTLGTGR